MASPFLKSVFPSPVRRHITSSARGMGLTYGLAAEETPSMTIGAGVAPGAGSSVVLDVVAVPAIGLDEPPWEMSPILHAHALIGHIVFGVATETTRRFVRRLLG